MVLWVAPELFWMRLVRLRDEWAKARETEALWHGADALSLAVGRADELFVHDYNKTTAFQLHLFGAEACRALCFVWRLTSRCWGLGRGVHVSAAAAIVSACRGGTAAPPADEPHPLHPPATMWRELPV